jgi:DNA-binding NtrC family response regulator
VDPRIADKVAIGETLQEIMTDTERQAIEAALRQSNGNRSHAARQLGITVSELQAKMREFQID